MFSVSVNMSSICQCFSEKWLCSSQCFSESIFISQYFSETLLSISTKMLSSHCFSESGY